MKPLSTVLVSLVVSVTTYVAMHLWVAPYLPSAGPNEPAVEVASLSGMTAAQARALAESRGLRLVLDEEKPNDQVAAGTICEQRPLPGSSLRRGDEIHAAVARRGDGTKVPRTAGMTPAAARELIERAQLRIGETTTVADPQTPSGLVIGTTPAEATDAPRQSSVQLHVSSGAQLAVVPQLFGKKLGSAKDLVEKAGFVLGTIKHGSNEDRDTGDVIGQIPKANENAAVGSKIDLVINSD